MTSGQELLDIADRHVAVQGQIDGIPYGLGAFGDQQIDVSGRDEKSARFYARVGSGHVAGQCCGVDDGGNAQRYNRHAQGIPVQGEAARARSFAGDYPSGRYLKAASKAGKAAGGKGVDGDDSRR